MKDNVKEWLALIAVVTAIKSVGGSIREYFARRELEKKTTHSEEVTDALAKYVLKDIEERIARVDVGSERYFELLSEKYILQYKLNKRKK